MKQAVTLASFGLTLFLSAAIMFAVQPMTGKMLLPLVGGTPAGWIVAMAFFQIMLLLGYLLAHALSRLDPYRQGACYITCLLAGAAFLPVALPAEATAAPGAFDVFRLLALCAGVPFIALSATSSTIQRLFTVTRHASAGDPYFLYMASNLGSFSGLLLYPVVIEPMLALDMQARAVSLGYGMLVLMAALCLLHTKLTGRSGPPEAAPSADTSAPPSRGLRLRWLALSFVPSSLLLGVTTCITTDVISAPMTWVLPLAAYLLTFVIAFSKSPVIPLQAAQKLQPYVISAAVLFIAMMQATWLTGWLGVVFYLAVFSAVALACHLQLAALRPLGNSRRLTEFYLLMSVGGALGGVLNAFIIPLVFDRLIEFPLMLLASFMLHPAFEARTPGGRAFIALLALSALLVNVQGTWITHEDARMVFSSLCAFGLIVAAPLFCPRLFRPFPLMLCMLAIFMVSQFAITDGRFMVSLRNFYGTIRVYDSAMKTDENTYMIRTMRHGSTIHGTQVLDPMFATDPTSYYARIGPLGDIFETFHPKNVAALGLGTGTVNCYYLPDRAFTYFELDPDVVKIAERDFTFLDKCVSARKPVIHVGDGRLELAKLKNEKFDLLVMDAFTSDSIPTHLLTKEAFALYFERLAENGVLAIHISNRYFKLWDAITATAATLGLPARLSHFNFQTFPFYAVPSVWMVVAKPPQMKELNTKRWRAVTPAPSIRPWTDNYSDLLDTLAFTQEAEPIQ